DARLDSALQGGIIVRESRRQETHRQLYDEDHVNYTVHISQHKDTLFVNGKSLQSNFLINTNTRYRFRLIHGGVCPVILSIASHPLLIIAMDGSPVAPKMTEAVEFAPGERVDFIVTANKPVSTYDFNFKPSSDQCLFKLKGKVQLVYNATGDAAGNILAESKVKSKVIEESSLKSGKPVKLRQGVLVHSLPSSPTSLVLT
ncbi:laccase-2-like, partial [Diaphorina citri]|uniref:Laccase-2-like n=1 Tax=Diaphorina citri TaxID=121845 RepID=A0A1S4ELW8_DIACI